MKSNTSQYPGAATVLLIAIVVMYIPWLGETLFYSKGEPREAIVAVSILQSGEWILPVNYGVDIPYKPPFLAWLIAGLSWLLNGGVVTEYLSRLPSALAAIAMIMGGYAWAKSIRGARFALIFSLVTITSFEVFRAAMACRLDMVLTACMVGAMYIMYDLRERRGHFRPARYTATILLLTCAVLTKGPVGALLPCLAVGIYHLLRGDRFFPTLGSMLAIAIGSMALPALWFYEAAQRGGQEFIDLLYEENIGRLTGTMSYESHSNPIWYNFVTLLSGLLPWTVLCLFSLANTKHFRRRALQPAGMFALTAAVTVVGFYCIPESKRSVYLLPAYPFVCYGITSLIEAISTRRTIKAFTWLMAILGILAPVAFALAPLFELQGVELSPIPWWGYAVLAIPVIAGFAWTVNRHSPVGHVLVIVWALYTAYTAVIMPSVMNPRSDSRALPALKVEAPAGVYTLADQNRLYSLNYYLNDGIRTLPNLDAARSLPSGSIILLQPETDTCGYNDSFRFEVLLSRSADFRRPVLKATKK